MSTYYRAIKVSAYQIEFSEADKEKAKAGLPASSHDGTVKYDNGEYSVLVHLGHDAKLAKEGEWVVTDANGNSEIVSNDEFEKFFIDAEEFEAFAEDAEQEDEEGETTVDHVVTDEDMKANPDLKDLGVQSGEKIGIPAWAVGADEKPVVESTPAEQPVAEPAPVKEAEQPAEIPSENPGSETAVD